MKNCLIIVVLMLITGCAYNPAGYLKVSANHELVDMRGFNKKKRLPTYNGKYIKQAQRNIKENNCTEDSEEENVDELIYPAGINRRMYRAMLDGESVGGKKKACGNSARNLHQAKREIEEVDLPSKEVLLYEIEQIKQELQAAKTELEKHSCEAKNEKRVTKTKKKKAPQKRRLKKARRKPPISRKRQPKQLDSIIEKDITIEPDACDSLPSE